MINNYGKDKGRIKDMINVDLKVNFRLQWLVKMPLKGVTFKLRIEC